MVKLVNKQHEQDQSNRIKGLKSDISNLKGQIRRMDNRIDNLNKELTKLKSKLEK